MRLSFLDLSADRQVRTQTYAERVAEILIPSSDGTSAVIR